MEHAFFTVLNMSVAGAFAILLALVLRPLLRRGAKWTLLIVWGVVALRLTVPVFFESSLAPLPAASFAGTSSSAPDAFAEKAPAASFSPESAAPAQTFRPVPTAAATDGPFVGQNVTSVPVRTARPSGTALPSPTGEAPHSSAPAATEAPLIPAITDETPSSPAGSGSRAVRILFWIWLAGCSAMLCYSLVSYSLLKRKLASGVLRREGVYESEYARSPFTLGILRPNIYIPFGLDDRRLDYVLGHEKAHLRAADHVWKALGFAVLSIHWFNPLVWLAYALFCRDLELACDERAVRNLSEEERIEYSQTLLDLSAKKHSLGPSPLAFGEGDAKARIKSVLSYKKPKAAVIVLAILLAAALAACSFTANKPAENGDAGKDADASDTPAPDNTPAPTGTPEPTATETPPFDPDSLGFTQAVLPVGDGEGEISVYTGFEDDVSTGPEDFLVQDGLIWVLNSAAPTRSVLCLYLDGSLARSYPIEPGYRPGQLVRLCVGSDKLYVIDLMGYMYVLDRESGEITATVSLPTGENFIGDGFAGSIVYMAEENGRLGFTVRTYTDTETFFTSYAYDPETARVIPASGVDGENTGVHYSLRDAATDREYRFDLPAGWMFTELLGLLPDGSCYVSAVRSADFPPYPRAVFCFGADGSLLYQTTEIAPGEASGVSCLRRFSLGSDLGTYAMLYDGSAFRLVHLTMFEDPSDASTEVLVYGSASKSGYYEFRSLGEKLLRGEKVEPVYFGYYYDVVFFRLEEDALRAYSERTTVTRTQHGGSGKSDTFVVYSGLIAEYPREVGELATQKLIEYANSYLGWGLSGNENFVSQGYAGEDWFALTTVDDSIQDLQVHCIFHYDGTEWREIPGNNGGLYLDYRDDGYGLCLTAYCFDVLNENIAFIGYSTKVLWNEETGWSHLYVYRTANGGQSWEKLDLVLPDEFIHDSPGYQLISPVFEGAHGVLPVVCLDGGRVVWFETFDYGASWTYHE
jgi:beta-lactamase regulating signal transducer with metallopeptidase domain